jgi:protein-S-isoprenylcysteine O-methyltransferase Ste14
MDRDWRTAVRGIQVVGALMIIAGAVILFLLVSFIIGVIVFLLQLLAVIIGIILVLGGIAAIVVEHRWWTRRPWDRETRPENA